MRYGEGGTYELWGRLTFEILDNFNVSGACRAICVNFIIRTWPKKKNPIKLVISVNVI